MKDLLRAGLGELAIADLNGDGWIDATDMALAMQGAYRTNGPTPSAEGAFEGFGEN